MRKFIENKAFIKIFLTALIIILLSCSFDLVYADYNDDVNVGNTSAQEVGDAIYRTGGWDYNHAGIYYQFTGTNHLIIHVTGNDWYDVFKPWYHVVQMVKIDDFKSGETYLGSYSSETNLSAEDRSGIIGIAEQLRDRSAPMHYTIWGQLDGKGLSWDGTIDDIDNLRCDGLVEAAYEMNGIDVWGKNQTNYSIVNHTKEHHTYPVKFFEPDPNTEVCPVVQRGGYEFDYTKLRASVPEPPSTLIDSPSEGSEQTGLFKITALAEDESGIRHVKFEYSTDHNNWLPLPGPDSETGKDGYGADGWGLRFDTVDAGINEGQVLVRVNATDKAGNTSDWTEVYYFIDNTGIIVTETLDPSTTTAGSPVTVSGNALYEGSGPVQNGTAEITTNNGAWTTTTDLDGDYSEVITAPNGSGYIYVTVSHDTSQGSAAEWLEISDGTHVSGTIVNDSIWTIAGSPYILTGSVTIPEGITLTISSGVTVEFTNAGSMRVNGTLNATGATFTWADGQNQWRGIRFDGAGSTASRLDGCMFERALGYFYSGNQGILYMTDTSPTVTGCTIHNSDATYGIWIEGGSPEISTSTISGISGYGIYVSSNSSPTVTGNTITGNGTGIYIMGGNSGTYQGNTITDNSYGIYASYSSNNPIFTGNAYSNNSNGDLVVSGTINTDVSWDDTWDAVYRISNLTIAEGASLTIATGKTVEFTNAGSMRVNGTLNATGATFTWADGQNQWRGIWFNGAGSSASRLDGCMFERALGYFYSGNQGILYMTDTSPTVTGCTIHNSDATYGIWIEGGSPEISTSTISGISGYGIYVSSNSSPTVTGNTITGNGTGIYIMGGNSGTYQGNTITDNSYGIYASYSSNNPIFTGNAYSNNSNGDLVVSGTINTDVSWDDTWDAVYRISNLTIAEGASLTIATGKTVEFTNAGSMRVNGTLNATGATFTWADGQNQWRGIWFNGAGSSASRLDGCMFERALGYFYSGNQGILYMTDTSPTVTGCTIHNSDATYGIWIEGGSPEISTSTISGISGYGIYVSSNSSPTVTGNTISSNNYGIFISNDSSGTYQGNTIAGNTSYGIYNSGTTVIDARNNYWGDPTGPYDPSDDRAAGGWYNPDGQGDKVTDYVAYESWITDPTDTDGDGIPDEWEIDNFQNLTTVDENTDHDGDGLLDRHEFYNTTDPKNPDTDDDGMSDGWEVDNRLILLCHINNEGNLVRFEK